MSNFAFALANMPIIDFHFTSNQGRRSWRIEPLWSIGFKRFIPLANIRHFETSRPQALFYVILEFSLRALGLSSIDQELHIKYKNTNQRQYMIYYLRTTPLALFDMEPITKEN